MDVVERIEKGISKLHISKLSSHAPAYVQAKEQEIELLGLAKLGAMVKKEFMNGCPLPKSINCKKCKLKNLCAVMDVQVPVINKG